MSTTSIFKAKTTEAYYVKVLVELLSNILKSGCFEFSENGIFLRQIDTQRKTLVDIELNHNNFQIYRINNPEGYHVNITLTHLYGMLKSIKKKDSLILSINDENLTELSIETFPQENTRRTISIIKIQQTQNVDIDLPMDYSRPIIIKSTEFQKTMKDMLNIGTTIKVESKGNKIIFSSDADEILKRIIEFGEDNEDSDTRSYSQTFSTDQFSRIIKLSALGSNIHIFPGHPLLFKTNIGNIGKIAIYIKSLEEIENEKNEE